MENSGVFVCILTIIGTIIGGGVVSLPYATLQTGIWLCLAMNFYSIITGIYSVYLLLEAKNMSGQSSFAQLGYYCFGRASIFVICFMMIVSCCGYPIVYFKIFGEAASSLMNNLGILKGKFWSSKEFSQIVLGVALLVFIIKKQISELKIAGFILLFGVILFAFFLFIRLCQGKGEDISDFNISKVHFSTKLLANIPTLILCYGFQSAFFTAFNSLKERTDRNGMKATIGSFAICFCLYLCINLVSLFLYGDSIEENIITNVGKSSDGFSIILQILFLLVSATHIPIVFFVGKEHMLIFIDEILRRTYSLRHSARSSVAHNPNASQNESTQEDHDAYLTMNPIILYVTPVCMYVLIIILSIVVKSLVLLLGIIGSISAMSCIFIAPGSFYIKCLSLAKDGSPTNYVNKSRLNYVLAWIYVVKGTIMMIFLLFISIYYAV